MEIARDNRIDMAKGMGIILVIAGHLFTYGDYPFRLIFSFHMPLFFFLSGYVFQIEKFIRKGEIRRKIIRTMGIPFLFFTLFGFLYYMVTGQLTIDKQLLYSFYKGQPAVCGSLWFLTCLTWVYLAAWWLLRKIGPLTWKRLLVIAVVCMFLGWHLTRPFHEYLPLKIEAVPAALMFFLFGYFVRQHGKEYLNGMLGVISLLGVAALSYINLTPNICLPEFGHLYYFLPAAFMGIYFILVAADKFQNRILIFIGRNSLLIFLADEFLRYIYITTLKAVTGESYVPMQNLPWQYCLLGTVVILVLAIACVYFLNPIYKWFSDRMSKLLIKPTSV